MKPDDSGLLDRLGGPIVVFGVIGLLVGAGAAPYAWNAATAPDGTVAVVEVHGTITGDTATAAVDDLREARQNDSIEAVALDVNSRGGSAAASEQLYLAVKRTQQTMPVVASVTGSAASGGYYAAVPADRIFVSPAGSVGSVGVRALLPSGGGPAGEITTGPDKRSTATEAEVRRRVETLRRAFVGSVLEERGDALDLTAEELSYAKLYSGSRGIEVGLADEVGGVDAAIGAAADRADLANYRTVRMESPAPSVLGQLGLNATASDGPTTRATFGYAGVDTVQYLMLHGQLETDRTVTAEVSTNATN
ncbi:S49 family peptidase [Halorussus marinus]|uniref:S49 family peptidase n=1 Tax=Halorussus marinus TaxID=2505976 RepID=UPI001B2FF0D5|nr:S49 family peptidase [Halorussus marinus]